MFTLTSTPVTFIGLLILFIWSLVWSIRDAVVAPTVPTRISSCVHALMGVTMILMVPRSWWHPLVGTVGPTTPLVVMAVCTAWMVFMAAWRTSWSAWGHAVMFAAMVWHLAAMRAMSAMKAASSGSSMHNGMHGGMNGGMHGNGGMGGMSAMQSTMHNYAVVGVPLMICLLIMAVAGAWRLISGRPENPTRTPACHVVATEPLAVRLSGLADFAMAFGMAWMSTGLLAPLWPFMGHLHP